MKLQRTLGLILATQLFTVVAAFAQGSYKAEAGGAPPADVPKAVQDALVTQGTVVVDAQGATLLEVWLPKTLAIQSTASSGLGILYGSLSEGTFLGVVHYPQPAADFRGQALKAGYYTLRYSQIPQDGNHMGVYSTQDAIHLCPLAADTDVSKTLTFAELIKLGRMASGAPHPAFLVMAPVTGDTFPSILKDDQGFWDLELKAHGSSSDLPIAITVVGKWQG
jgi:hypothetical protein